MTIPRVVSSHGVRAFPIVLMLATLALTGCGGRLSPTAPGDATLAPGRDAGTMRLAAETRPYPLAIGNRWQYRREGSYEVRDGDDVLDRGTTRSNVVRAIVCEETYGDRTYRVEETTQHPPDGVSATPVGTWVRYRQDREGLHELDIPISFRPFCDDKDEGIVASARGDAMGRRAPGSVPLAGLAPRGWTPAPGELPIEAKRAKVEHLLGRVATPADGDPAPGPTTPELLRLPLPMHPGQSWWIRNEPGAHLRATIDAREVLDLPVGREVAWRIRYDWPEVLGPGDHVTLWYGRDGYLAMDARLRADYVDPAGTPIGIIVFDERELLTGKHFVER